jgi:UrcA family protein
MQKIKTQVAAAFAAALFAVSPAQAETGKAFVVAGAEEVITATVSFADLNLSSAAGRNSLDARVRAAVRRVCPGTSSILNEKLREWDCEQSARNEVAAKITKITAPKQ